MYLFVDFCELVSFLKVGVSMFFFIKGRNGNNFFFFLNDPPPTDIYPLPLHAALPISLSASSLFAPRARRRPGRSGGQAPPRWPGRRRTGGRRAVPGSCRRSARCSRA